MTWECLERSRWLSPDELRQLSDEIEAAVRAGRCLAIRLTPPKDVDRSLDRPDLLRLSCLGLIEAMLADEPSRSAASARMHRVFDGRVSAGGRVTVRLWARAALGVLAARLERRGVVIEEIEGAAPTGRRGSLDLGGAAHRTDELPIVLARLRTAADRPAAGYERAGATPIGRTIDTVVPRSS